MRHCACEDDCGLSDGPALNVLHDSLLLLIAFVLVLLNGFFVAAEFAIVKLRNTRVAELRQIGGWRGHALARVHGQIDAYLSACQLGITLASLALGWIGEPAFAHLVEQPLGWAGLQLDRAAVEAIAFVVAFSLISFLHIVIGELAPKSMAIRRPESVSLWTALPLWLFYWLMYPFIWLLNNSANLVLRLAGLDRAGDEHQASYSPRELRSILHSSRPEMEGEARDTAVLAKHALELPELDVSELMRPLREMTAIRDGQSHAEVRRILQQQHYSRYPLLDESDQVLGVLHVKDILEALLDSPGEDFPARLRRQLHEPLIAREDDSLADLLRRFRHGTSHFALVLDQDFQRSGFLTLEDLLEALLGDITDEHEARRPQQVQRQPRRLKDGHWLARGDTPIFMAERELGRAIAGTEESSTLAGLLMERLDRMPAAGDVVEQDGVSIEVLRVRGARVESVQFSESGEEDGLPEG